MCSSYVINTVVSGSIAEYQVRLLSHHNNSAFNNLKCLTITINFSPFFNYINIMSINCLQSTIINNIIHTLTSLSIVT